MTKRHHRQNYCLLDDGDRQPRLSRRLFLRGTGVALALPWIESAPARSAESGKSVTRSADLKPPVRFACVFFSNGVEPAHWWAKGSGASMELGPGLRPMEPLRDDMVFIRGLFNEQAVKHKSPHLGRMANLLSGAWVTEDQNDLRVGKTMDQVLAQQLGHRTDIPSLVLGIEPTELRLEDGLSMIYGSCISWTSATKPATKEIYPARVFDQLAGGERDRGLDRSVLDEVLDDAHHLRRQISRGDRVKLEDYLESIRSIEKRIDRAGREDRLEGWKPALTEPNLPRPQDELPQDVPEHMKLMMDLIVLAFQMDKTRIATCMLNNDLSQMNFGFLDGVRGSLHLDLTHNGRDPELEAMYLKTNQFHVQQFAYLVSRLKEIEEGTQSLLDNSILLCCSNLFDGDKHQADHMPMLLAGGGGGSIESGRVLDYSGGKEDTRRACSLYLSLMDRIGVQLSEFGDTNQRLAGL